MRLCSSWNDPRWRDSVQRLTSAQKLVLDNSLRALLQSLKSCQDPLLDNGLRPWGPTRWSVPFRQESKGEWVEYRLGDDDNRGRAIVCFDRKENIIYLVARTAIHDLQSLRELTASITPSGNPIP